MVLYQGQLSYDIQLQITNEIINYNPDKGDIIRALILPNQIYGKWPKNIAGITQSKITQKWTNKIDNQQPSNKTVHLLVVLY